MNWFVQWFSNFFCQVPLQKPKKVHAPHPSKSWFHYYQPLIIQVSLVVKCHWNTRLYGIDRLTTGIVNQSIENKSTVNNFSIKYFNQSLVSAVFFCLWPVDRTKRDIRRYNFGLWEAVMDIFQHIFTPNSPTLGQDPLVSLFNTLGILKCCFQCIELRGQVSNFKYATLG